MIDSLQLATSLIEAGVMEEAVHEMMLSPQLMMLAESSQDIKTAMSKQISSWRGQLDQELCLVSHEQAFAKEISLYQQSIEKSQDEFVQSLPHLLEALKDESDFYAKASDLANHPQHRHSPVFQSYFCNQWFKQLKEDLQHAQMQEMELQKKALLQDLYQRAENINAMTELKKSGSKLNLGRLWDMAAAKLSKQELHSVSHYARILKKHQGLQDIAEQLGRMADQVDDPSAQQSSEEWQLLDEELQNASDDIVGIHEGDDLTKLLPSETLFLAYPELEVIFYKHLLDKRLLNYQMQNKQRKLVKVQTGKQTNPQQYLDKGPFILAVDSSGSMQGYPEKCAKALAYGLMQIALAEKRDCYVMMFSTEQITYELSKQDGLREMINFLNYSFHGGTDMNAVLSNAITSMQQQQYKNADLLILSDFIAPKPPEPLLAQIDLLKQQQNRFHAINLSRYGNPELMQIFDKLWHYT